MEYIGVKAICIKSYQDEDDLNDYKSGKIEADQIKVYKVGEIGFVIEEYYSREHWLLIKE